MPLTIVDTDVLIDVSRNDAHAIAFLSDLETNSQLAISSITQMELIVGCRNKTELRDLQQFLQRFQILQITDQISDHAADLLVKYNLSHGLLIPDALIAATAIILDEPFVTKNQRDYRFIDKLQLQPYT